MSEQTMASINDSVSKVNDEIAVGSDMEFQERWWRFENAVWVFFTLVVIAALLGCFGRGLLAKGRLNAGDGSVSVSYDRIARYSTPSKMTVEFEPAAIHDGYAQLWVDRQCVKSLGLTQALPRPARTALLPDGLLYTFPVEAGAGSAELSVEPPAPGIKHFKMGVPGFRAVEASVVVMP